MRKWINLMDDQDTKERYLHGECMVLANTLSGLLGGDLVGIFDDVWTTIPRHVGVLLPGNKYADARGIIDASTFLDGFKRGTGTRIEPLTLDRMKAIWGRRILDWEAPVEDLRELGFLRSK